MKSIGTIVIAASLLAACSSTKKSVSPTSPSPEVVTETVLEIPEQQRPQIEDDTVIEPSPEQKEYLQQLPDVVPTVPAPETPAVENNSDEVVTKVTPFDHNTFNKILKQNVSEAGNVNYDAIKKNWSSLRSYLQSLGENMPDDDWSENEKLAYWMNAYNAMTIDLILRHQPLESIKDIKNPWEQRFWKLGDKYYNLDEIEHQILRKMNDPRIHFGINCASFSCPPLLNEAFTAGKVDNQLETLAVKFINDPKRNKIGPDRVEISKIFDWFAKDFKQRGSVIDFLNNYATTQISADAKVRYMDYDWTLNR